MFIPKQHIDFNLNTVGGLLNTDEGTESSHNQFKWLENALIFNVYNSKNERLRALVRKLFEEINGKRDKQKEALKAVLINLWIANFWGIPVRYSRDRNRYSHDKRYGKMFFKYDTLIPVIDALHTHGYIEQKNGRSRYEDKSIGYEARMWATPLLVKTFQDYQLIAPDFFYKPELEETVVLNKEKKNTKNKVKVKVKYRDINKTIKMRNNLALYNEFVKNNYITTTLNKDTIIDKRFLLQKLNPNIFNNKLTINYTVHNNQFYTNRQLQYISKLLYNKYKTNKSINNNTITKMFSCEPMKHKASHRKFCYENVHNFQWYLYGLNGETSYIRKKLFKNKTTKDERKEAAKTFNKIIDREFTLEDIGIKHLQFSHNNEVLHRVFNRGNTSFKYGGRAYGAVYQGLPKEMRKLIRINDEPTVEVDFSAYHLRMLYHLIGEDYREDPYSVCAGKEYRDIFKIANLVIINSKDEEKAIMATRKELVSNKIKVEKTDEKIKWMISKLKEAHEPIAGFICRDMGTMLMNIDSDIMDSVLMRLMELGILGLNVFDSVIVPAQHKGIVKQVMTEEYEKVMGFKPVF